MIRAFNLSILSEKTGIYESLNDKQKDLLDMLNPLNIEARYPTRKTELFKSLTKEKCEALIKSTKEFLGMDKNKALKKTKDYATLVKEKFSGSSVILFGSFANGKYNENSDIDIAVIVKKIYGDFLENELNLYRLRRNIDNRIEPILLTEGEDPSGFLEEIKKTGLYL